MNSTIYLLGKYDQGYTQYPLDSSQDIFQKMADSMTSAKTQVSIHRNGDLMYYTYFRKLDKTAGNQFFGIALLFNGVMLTNFKSLFELFENTFTNVVFSGEILTFNEKGNIKSNLSKLEEKSYEVERIVSLLQSKLITFENTCKNLPPVNYGVSSQESKTYSINQDENEILTASHTYSYTHLLKAEDYDTSKMSSYLEVIKNLNSEKEKLEKQNTKLKDDFNKVLAQKKQYRTVGFLVIAVLICGFTLFAINGSLNKTKEELSSANDEIVNLKYKISKLNDELIKKENSLSEYKSKYKKAETMLKRVSTVMPILISDIQIANVYQNGDIETDYGNTIYSYNTMYLKPKIVYTGVKTYENIELYVKLITPSGTLSVGTSSPEGYSFSTSMYVEFGEDSKELTGFGNTTKGNWSSGTYRYEIWYEGLCLKTKSFTIY